jgi:transcriptional pleiotropic repressor
MEISNKIASIKHLYLMNINKITLEELMTHISQLNGADVFWVDSEMKVLMSHLLDEQHKKYYEETLETNYLEINDFIYDITTISHKKYEIGQSSLIYDSKDWGVKTNVYSIPVMRNNSSFEFLVLFTYDKELEEDFNYFAEILSIIFSTAIQMQEREDQQKSDDQRVNVETAIDALSYSELEAVKCILNVLEGDEGYLVASKVADEFNITRSIIVNALRKLESAGLLKSKSLGMKGTHIKIMNSRLREFID